MKRTTISLAYGIIGMASTAYAQDALNTLEPTVVVGSKERAFELTGASAYIDADTIRQQNYTNINRILARVPGVYVREETGFGNFPNISLRGGDGTRSEKVSLMEDGILTSPAPYSAPAAYYSPRGSRMSGIEVLKGSSQIQYGPQTTGGVVNYLSTAIPDNSGLAAPQSGKGSTVPVAGSKEDNFYWRSTYGSNDTFFNHAYYGDTVVTENGKFGYLFELLHEQSDGFRSLQGGGDTGFEVFEPMLKLSWQPDSALKQRFEFKYGYTDFEADETYVGLTEEDLNDNPYHRYAGTKFDNMQTQQHRTYLKWIMEPTADLKLETTAYYNEFGRNWYKIRGIDLLDAGDVALLKGTAAGDISIRANNRDYQAYGLQLNGLYNFETGSVAHDLGFGVRYHEDEASRFQRDDTIVADGTGGFTIVKGAEGSGGNRIEETEALALWIKDDIQIGNLTVSPGIRYEHMDLSNTDYLSDATDTVAAKRSGDDDYFAPGAGFKYDVNDTDNVFGGVFKGYSIPSPRSVLKDNVDKEESLGYELGYRRLDTYLAAEFVAFFTDFDNLVGSDAGDPDADPRNAGEAEVWGFEAQISYDFAAACDKGYSTPTYVSATWTSAELKSDLTAGGGDGIYDGATDGSNVPYIPEWKIAAGVGFLTDTWGVNLDATYTSDSFGTANNYDDPVTNAKQGRIDSALIFDFSAHYAVTESLTLVGGVQNLFDEEYLASRVPIGPRLGSPRQTYVGFNLTY